VTDFGTLAVLHAIAGASAGCGLSITHGTIGRATNPHRLFAIVNIALGVFAIVFLGATPNLILAFGGSALFKVFAGIMALAALAAGIAFPIAPVRSSEDLLAEVGRLRPAVWYGIAGVSCMALIQAMMFSFVERIGIDRGFGAEAVTGVLITLGFVNLLPAPLAALLQTRMSANTVVLVAPVLQAIVALAITMGSGFLAYATPTIFLPAIMIFGHTFAFGLLSRLDQTARALAGTPAMLMVGAAIGPILGGTLVKSFGYGSLGIAAVVVATVAVALFSQVPIANSPLAPLPNIRKSPDTSRPR
jgi:predicted MFS family arabinose efflux permease